MMFRVSYIPGGAGFLPPTVGHTGCASVAQLFFHHPPRLYPPPSVHSYNEKMKFKAPTEKLLRSQNHQIKVIFWVVVSDFV